MRAVLVTHSHWDREWYRTFQDFRARLVDLVDRVLDLCAEDPGYRFLLDGQTVVLEDYREIRPQRADELARLCREGRIALGPWYVQPDSLLPSGEAHVRNLLLGRRVGEAFGPVSRVGYTPDSFGHPAQFPQLLAGCGIGSFVYWRGHGDEIDELPAEYDWVAPDGSRVIACHLGKGYFAAGTAPGADLEAAGARIAALAKELGARTRSDIVLLLNGIDHALPEARTATLAEAIAGASGFAVERGLLDDFVAGVEAARQDRPRFTGELVGARVAPLLPGVWSTRTWIKLANRAAEAALEGWAEPFAALGQRHGLPDEAPALRLAWKELLKNQAHDSICGCSRDEVHEQMRPRFDTARELADQTATRCLERLAGLGAERRPPWTGEFDVLVANPSPRQRTDVVRFPFDFHPYVVPEANPLDAVHPTVLHDLGRMRFTVDGEPARLVPAEVGRLKLVPERGVFDLEFVARDVPPLGVRRARVRLAPDAVVTEDAVESVEAGSAEAQLAAGAIRVMVEADGTFTACFGDESFTGLGALESVGDRGDSYDFDAVAEGPGLVLEEVSVERRRHPSGIEELHVVRRYHAPARLAASRRERSEETAPLTVATRLRVAPGVPRIDLEICVDNAAEDYRLRMKFPVDRPVERFRSATTFDVATRTPGARDGRDWVQAPPRTFPHQGFVHAGGLTVVAPGLPEAEVTASGAVAITLLRCVGSLSRPDLDSRPGPAGPGTDTPGAQCPGRLRARLSLFAGFDPAAAREAELGLRAVAAGETALLPESQPVLSIEPAALLLSGLKPAEDGDGMVLRVLNPTDATLEAEIRLGFAIASASPVQLDETPISQPLPIEDNRLRFPVPPHSLRSLRIR